MDGWCARAPWVCVLALAGCAGGAPAAGPDAAAPADAARSVVAPAPPAFGACEPGWAAVTFEGLPACAPWDGARPTCERASFVYPGEPACVRVGSPCAADGFPATLPAGRAVVFIDDDAAPGGDGRAPATAFATLADALTATPGPAVFALATGRYRERGVSLGSGQSLVGACVEDTVITSDVIDGAALIVMGGDATLRDVAIEAPGRGAIRAEGTSVRVEQVEVRAWQNAAIGVARGTTTLDRIALVATAPAGVGIDVGGGSSVRVTRALIVESGGAGIAVHDGASALEGEDIAVDGVRALGMLPGIAAVAGAGARLVLTRVQLSGATEYLALATGAGATLEIRQAMLRKADADAVVAADGGHARVERVLVERTAIDGFFSFGAGATLDVVDAIVRDVFPTSPSMRYGRGVQVFEGGAVSLERVAIFRPHEAGIWVESAGSTLVATDVRIEDVLPDAATSLLGAGLIAQRGGSAVLERVAVRTTHTFGIIANVDGSIVGHDTSVQGVAEAECARSSCPENAGGFGVSAAWRSSVRLTSFEVDGASPCGVVVLEDAAMDLAHGVVSHADVGACVQVPGFDPERLHADVEYRDVGVPLQATSYVLPTL